MNEAKIQFSVSEMELMNNADIILTKNKVIHKIKSLFEDLQDQMIMEPKIDENESSLFKVPGKISRGENYNGLPYLILDFPRKFNGKNIFTIRTMFWWGNFFSSTLHLSGLEKTTHLPKIEMGYEVLRDANYFIGVSEDQWLHHFYPDNYISIKSLSKNEFLAACRTNEHIKIAAKWPLDSGHLAANDLLASWKFFMYDLNLITA